MEQEADRLTSMENTMSILKEQIQELLDINRDIRSKLVINEKRLEEINSLSSLEEIFLDFGLNFREINVFLKKYNGMIAGGSALHAFCQLEGKFDGDIDIWIQANPGVHPDFFSEEKIGLYKKYSDLNEHCPYRTKVYNDLSKILKNFKVEFFDDNNSEVDYRHNELFKKIIYKMYEFKLSNGRKVQLFLTYLNNSEILDSFDLSCCATAWNGSEFYCLDPESTKNRIAYRLKDQHWVTEERKIKRENKYTSRGFKIIPDKDDVTV